MLCFQTLQDRGSINEPTEILQCFCLFRLGWKTLRTKLVMIHATDVKEPSESLSVSSRATHSDSDWKLSAGKNIHTFWWRAAGESRTLALLRLHIRVKLFCKILNIPGWQAVAADWLMWLEVGGIVHLCERKLQAGWGRGLWGLTVWLPTTRLFFFFNKQWFRGKTCKYTVAIQFR